nr:EOG090X0755 [Cyclestheria hislopi]
MKDLESKIDSLIKYASTMNNLDEAVSQCEAFAKHYGVITQSVLDTVQEINRITREKQIAMEQQKAAVPQDVKQPSLREQQTTPVSEQTITQKSVDHGGEKTEKTAYVNVEDYKVYTDLLHTLQKQQEAYSPITSSGSLKQFKFHCQKAVSTPVNAISPVSPSHLRDKYDRLFNLLKGNPVEVGERRFVAAQQKGGLEFCADLLARKFVRQGEDVVSSNPDAAFAIAAVIATLWSDFPTLGKLILGHFYKTCPYLVPYYVPQEGQSDQEYYTALGYEYIDGQREEQDKFLKRMTGVTRLYAAILISVPRQQRPNPHGIQYGWKLLASLLNLPPRAEITVTVIYNILDVAGHAMSQVYGKQFQKLLHILCTNYFSRIQQVTPEGCGGPTVRLDDFLQNSIKKGRISPPSGQLSPNFW